MKKILLTFLLLSFVINASFAQSKDEVLIREVLEAQRQAWNKADIDTYMQGYWQSDSLMFIGKSGITYGWQNTLTNYQKRYPDTAAMGHLDFDILQVRKLPGEYAMVIGKWNLIRSIGNIGGYFSLLFRKIQNKWVIIADHTS